MSRYPTLKLDQIISLPVKIVTSPTAHLYALLPEGIAVINVGDLRTNLILFGTKCERTAVRMHGELLLFPKRHRASFIRH